MAKNKNLAKFYPEGDQDAYEDADPIGSKMPKGNACNPVTRSGGKKRRASGSSGGGGGRSSSRRRSGHGSSKKTKIVTTSRHSGSGKRGGGGSKMKARGSGKQSKSKGIKRRPCRPPGPFGDYLRDYWNAKRRVDKSFNKKITDAVRDAARCWRNLTSEQRLYYTRRYCKGYQVMKRTGQWCGSRRLQKINQSNRKSGGNRRGKNGARSKTSKSR